MPRREEAPLSHSSKLAVSCVSAPKTSNQKGNK